MDFSNLILTDVKEICPVSKEKGQTFHMEARKTHGLIVARSGTYLYRQGETELFSDTGHVVYLPKGATYDLKCLTSGVSMVINFHCSDPDTGIQSFSTAEHFEAELHKLLCYCDHTVSHRLLCIGTLYQIFSRLAHSGCTCRPTAQNLPILPSLNYMKQHFQDPTLSLAKIAKVSNVSTVYFRKLFTTCYGFSPMQYVRTLRMNHAKELLCDGERTIAEIGRACGYDGAYSFSNAFKQMTGLSPTVYMRHFTEI